MSASIGFVIGAAMAGSAAYAAARKVLERRRTRRALRATVPLDASLPEGTAVRVTGTVRITGETIEAPLSGRRCIAHRSRIYLSMGRPDLAGVVGSAREPRETARAVPFAIERPDGSTIAIDSEHVVLELPAVKLDVGDRDRCGRFALTHAISSKERHRVTYEELVVEDGMQITVAGTLMKDIADAPTAAELGLRDEQPPVVRLAGSATHPILIGRA